MAGPQTAASASASRGLATLKRRSEFLRVRKGARSACAAFVLEAMARGTEEGKSPAPRFGFTVSRQVGGAVERNRIRRRLKAAVRSVQTAHARGGYDYVLIARRPALDCAFDALVSDLVAALARVHAGGRRRARN